VPAQVAVEITVDQVRGPLGQGLLAFVGGRLVDPAVGHGGVGDVVLDHAGIAAEVVAPHVVEDLRLGEDAFAVQQQEPQHLELGRGQLHGLAAPRDPERVLVDLEVGVAETARRRRRPTPSQDRPHPRDQLFDTE
jgi:hypothetical protein